MRKVLRKYVGRTVVVQVDGDALRGTLQEVCDGALVLSYVEASNGQHVDGLSVVPFPVLVQVV